MRGVGSGPHGGTAQSAEILVPRTQTMETFKKARAETLKLPEKPTHHSREIYDPR
jgi:hypothetical protein